MNDNNKESALSRWSRRKHEAELPTPVAEQPMLVETAENLAANQPIATETEDKPVLTDADMPAIETLNEDSDFSGFMSAGVSDKLRNLALRKLFNAPIFNIRDGLDEYDEDYTSFEKLGDIVTCDMKHQIEMKEKKRLEALEAEQAEDSVEEIEEAGEIEEVEEMEALTEIENEPENDEAEEIVIDSEPERSSDRVAENEQ